MSNSLQAHGLYSPWHSPGQNTGVDSCSILQGVFPTQGLNPGLHLCRRTVYQLSHIPGSGRSPEEGTAIPAPMFLPGELHGQESLMGYSLWDCNESDTTERLTHTYIHMHTFRQMDKKAMVHIHNGILLSR